jgi:hypothetical protein
LSGASGAKKWFALQPYVEEIPRLVDRKEANEKKVSRSGSGFTKEEDKVLCSAFLNVSKDPITDFSSCWLASFMYYAVSCKDTYFNSFVFVGVNQTQGGYYKRLHAYYNTYKPEESNQSQIAIQYRWGAIHKAVNKFCGFKSTIDRRNESGKNEQDRVNSIYTFIKILIHCSNFIAMLYLQIDDAIKMYEASEPFHFMHC